VRPHLPLMILILAAAGGAVAQNGAAMAGMSMSSSDSGAKTGHGIGVVMAIDKAAGTVTIKHGPIPSAGWPAMTMTFRANPTALLSAMSVGQTIAFDMKAVGMAAEITSIRSPS